MRHRYTLSSSALQCFQPSRNFFLAGIVAGLSLILSTAVHAQNPAHIGPHPKYEFRAAWISTVVNLDWPAYPGQPRAQAKADLEAMLDALHEAGINAVHFQVRTEADALYNSPIEPWSYWLTGEQGAPPSPSWDPLRFAIRKAHERGMELHAWLNPYRADRGSNYPKSPDHVTNTHPQWILQFGNTKILNPGIPAVRNHVVSVVEDIATRYDVDGLHIDDYFYPYPPNQITNEDQASYQTYRHLCASCNNIGDWRRWNTFKLVEMIHDELESIDPGIAWGVSPFGIWKNGVPSGIVGMDAYSTIYIDAVSWQNSQIVDYVTPQLYWRFGGGQDYGTLATWWESKRNGRHFYPGHGLYRSDPNTWSNTLYPPQEIPNQVRFNRNHSSIMGSTFFRAENITQFHSRGFADSLKQNLYTNPALTPIMPWKSMWTPPSPGGLSFECDGSSLHLSWSSAGRHVVYRIPGANPDLEEAMQDGRNVRAIVRGNSYDDTPPPANGSYTYVVTRVSWNSVESNPSNTVVVNAGNDCGGGQVGEIIVDSNNNHNGPNAETIPGSGWNAGSYGNYYGTGYYWHLAEPSSNPVRFRFHLPSSATMTVSAWWTQGSNRSPAAPFLVYNAGGTHLGTVYKNQRPNGGQWNTLGTYAFTAGWNEIRVSYWTSDGVVIADAIRVQDAGNNAGAMATVSSTNELSPPSPNPITSVSTVSVTVARSQRVGIAVYDAMGRRVQTLFEGIVSAGESKSLTIDASGLAAGVYVIRAVGEDIATSRQVTVVR